VGKFPERALAAPLQALFQASGGNYGNRRLSASLRARGLFSGHHRVRRLMKQQGLNARWKRKFVHTDNYRHDLPCRWLPTSWAGASTRLSPTQPGRLTSPASAPNAAGSNLATGPALDSHKIVGWTMTPNMPAELACSALQMAIAPRQPKPGLSTPPAAASTPVKPTTNCCPAWPGRQHEPQGQLWGAHRLPSGMTR
jgi:transposase InsO family protein